MADFRPETTVYLFESTGVDAENQPFFQSEGAKMGWYSSHRVFTFNDYSYQRETRQYIRVKEKAVNLRKCDMMAFKNGSGKWILCNILSVDFINPNTTEITFQTDSMATFIEDITWCECWINREMQENDWNGSVPSFNNLQPEGLETGIMMRTPEFADGLTFVDFSMIVLSAYSESGDPGYGTQIKAGYPESLNTIVMRVNETNRLSNMIQTYAEKGILDGIMGIVICPSQYADSNSLYTKTTQVPPNYAQIDGYSPNNGKCFSGEFYRLELSNQRGNVSEILLDHIVNPSQVTLVVEGAFCGGTGGMLLYPANYSNGKANGVIIYNDIQVPYIGNAFTNWLAQNKYGLAAEIGAGIGMTIAGAVTGSAAIGAGGVMKAAGSITKILQESVNPLAVGGQAAGSGLAIATRTYGFLINWLHPQAPNIQAIDEFFSRFGYRTNRLKKPNVNTRPLWNYVQTSGAVVRGPFSYSDKVKIQDMLDNGVTFWHVPAVQIGDYSNMSGNRG